MAEREEQARRIHARLERERAEERGRQLSEARDLVRARVKGHADAHKRAWPPLLNKYGEAAASTPSDLEEP